MENYNTNYKKEEEESREAKFVDKQSQYLLYLILGN